MLKKNSKIFDKLSNFFVRKVHFSIALVELFSPWDQLNSKGSTFEGVWRPQFFT